MTRYAVSFLLATILLTFGCKKDADPHLFEQAEYLILEQRYEEAIPLLKQFLLNQPRHSGAHYYLGRCYFASTRNFWFALAEGEIQTALVLFERDGKKSAIPRFSDVYFEFICHIDMAKIRLKQAMFLMENLGDFGTARTLLEQAAHSVEHARRIAPDSPDVPTMEQLINDFRRSLELPSRPVSPPRTEGFVI